MARHTAILQRPIRSALTVLTLLAGAGCDQGCARPPLALAEPAITFTVMFGPDGCISEVVPELKNCVGSVFPVPPACSKVTRTGSVTFVSGAQGKNFALHFDPFRKAPIISTSGRDTFPIDAGAQVPKLFTFSVREHPPAKSCQAFDPLIIVDR